MLKYQAMNEKKLPASHYVDDYSDLSDGTPRYSYADEWEADDDVGAIDSEPVRARIIARMPDLGIGHVATDGSVQAAAGQSLWGSVFSRTASVVVKSGSLLCRLRPAFGERKMNVLATLLIVAVIFSVVGGAFVYKNNKRKPEMTKAAAVEATPPTASVADTKITDSKIAKATTTEAPVAKEIKPAPKAPATPAPKAAVQKVPTPEPAAKPAAKPVDKPVAKPAPAAKAVEKPAVTPPPSAPAPAPQPSKAVAEKTPEVKAPAAPAAVVTAPPTPWERPATDNYTPWAMNASERLEAVSSNAAPPESTKPATAAIGDTPGFSTTQTAAPQIAQQTAPQTLVPMQPINPVPTAQQPYAAPQMAPPQVASPAVIPQHYVPTHAYTPQPANTVPPMYPMQQNAVVPTAAHAVAPTPTGAFPPQTAAVPGMQPALPQGYYGSNVNHYGNGPHPQATHVASVPQQSVQQPYHQTPYQVPHQSQNTIPQQLPYPSQPYYPAMQQPTPPQPYPAAALQQGTTQQGTVYSQGRAYPPAPVYHQGAVTNQSQGLY